MRFLLHISWIWMLFFTIFGFLLAAILNPISVVIFNSCELGNKIISDNNTFATFTEINADIRQKMDICLFGNGDLLQEFNIKSEIDNYNNLSIEIDKVLNQTVANNSGKLVEITTTAGVWNTTIDSYIQGNNSAPDSNATDNTNPLISINNYTKWTDHSISGSFQNSVGSCQISKDEWQFSLNKCSKTTKWVSTNANTALLNSDVCIDIRQFDTAGISQRYASTSGCSGGVQAQINSYFAALKKYDNSRSTVFNAIKTDLAGFSAANDVLIGQVGGLVTKIKNIKGNLDLVFNSISKEPDGIIHSVNCQFLKVSAQLMLDSMCVSFLTPTYIVTIMLITASIISLLASYIAYFKAMDAAKKLKGRQAYQDYEMGAGKIM